MERFNPVAGRENEVYRRTRSAADAAPSNIHEISKDTANSLSCVSNLMGMAVGICNHGQSTLVDGRVLVTGGYGNSAYRADCAVYDPVTNAWSAVQSLDLVRSNHAQVTLADGRVLVIGGRVNNATNSTSCKIYDPVINTWSAAADLPVGTYEHAASLLTDGTVLVTGGTLHTEVQLYDPVANTWTARAAMGGGRDRHGQVTLNDGTVLVIGGRLDGSVTYTTALYDPVANTWSQGPSLPDIVVSSTKDVVRAARVGDRVLVSAANNTTTGGLAYALDLTTNTFITMDDSIGDGFCGLSPANDTTIYRTGGGNSSSMQNNTLVAYNISVDVAPKTYFVRNK